MLCVFALFSFPHFVHSELSSEFYEGEEEGFRVGDGLPYDPEYGCSVEVEPGSVFVGGGSFQGVLQLHARWTNTLSFGDLRLKSTSGAKSLNGLIGFIDVFLICAILERGMRCLF